MSRFGVPVLNPKDLHAEDFAKAVVEAINRLAQIVDSEIEFGNPQDPTSDSSTTLAGTAAGNHPGSLLNIRGSFVELDVVAADTAVTCFHNLSVPVAVAGEPNVRWFVFGYVHSGAGANAASTLSCNFEVGDTVTTDSIQLRFYVGGARTVGAAPNALKVTLFFIPAVRRP